MGLAKGGTGGHAILLQRLLHWAVQVADLIRRARPRCLLVVFCRLRLSRTFAEVALPTTSGGPNLGRPHWQIYVDSLTRIESVLF